MPSGSRSLQRSLPKMKRKLVEAIRNVFEPPIYVFTGEGLNTFCDKFVLDGKKWKNQRYVIGPDFCTCPGFRHRGKCKHLDMVAGRFEGNGVARPSAATILARMLEECGDLFPVKDFEPDWDRMPTTVKAMDIEIPAVDDLIKVVGAAKTGSSETMVLSFVCKKEPLSGDATGIGVPEKAGTDDLLWD